MNCIQDDAQTDSSCVDLYSCYSVSNVAGDAIVNLDELSRNIQIDGSVVFALIDTGSQLNILRRSCVPNVQATIGKRDKVFAWGGFPIPIIGIAELEVSYKGTVTTAMLIHIVDDEGIGSQMRSLSFGLCQGPYAESSLEVRLIVSLLA